MYKRQPEGEDIINYEVATALRAGALADGLADVAGDAGDADAEPLAVPVAASAVFGAEPEDRGPGAAASTPTRAERRRLSLRDYYRENVSTFGVLLHEELARLEKERDDFQKDIPETMVMADRDEPRQAYVFMRGDYRKKGPEVDARTPEALPPMPADLQRNRLGLARWLVSGDHPLTARVAVNRIWQQYFGTGIVSTAEDFGVRGELPSHPELLDWLAVELVENGWDLKAIHRRIVLSATYRQAAVTTPEKLERDPENRLLSRGPRVRLSAEMIRDNALAVSGLLVEELGGPSVKPYQAPGLWSEVTGGRDYRRDKGEAQYRRGIYVYWKRRVPYPSMVTFDAAKRETCTVTRAETNTPLQALVLLNNPVYVEAAKMFGQRLVKEAEDDAARLALGFRLCTSRAPSGDELAILTALLEEQRAAYRDDAKGAAALLKVGDAEVDDELDPQELAAWAAVASALLNLDATIHKG